MTSCNDFITKYMGCKKINMFYNVLYRKTEVLNEDSRCKDQDM